jgi:hypothetical protein
MTMVRREAGWKEPTGSDAIGILLMLVAGDIKRLATGLRNRPPVRKKAV